MPSEAVHPLRINKTPTSSPTKMQRPLSEISPMAQRRNSPSFNQPNKKMANRDSSPFDASPFNGNSPRLFWQGRDTLSPRAGAEKNPIDRDLSPSPRRRSSIENLKKVSRVKNSTMFAREHKNEYDPTASPVVERPLAAGRPLAGRHAEGSLCSGRASDVSRDDANNANTGFRGHRRGESQSKIPILSPSKQSPRAAEDVAVQQLQDSPIKSSLSKTERFSAVEKFFDPENGTWSEEEDHSMAPTPRPLRRHAKSVTFDVAPPQVNEYEMVTPDPSSVASGSRQGSYDSADEYDDSFDNGYFDQDDSFDASLEDTDKTPVVLPEDWRHMSPEVANTSLANTFEDPFDGQEDRGTSTRTDSRNSDGEPRPLPPVPGLSSPSKARRESAIGVAGTAKRMSNSQRSLPSPPPAPSVSKSDILNMRNGSLSLEERLQLMGLHNADDYPPTDSPKSARKSSAGKDKGAEFQIHEDQANDDDASGLEGFMFPQISRESILRKIKSRTFNDEDFDHSTPNQSYADLDPDVPIPSREASSNFDENIAEVTIKQEVDAESEVDVYAIPDLYSVERSPSRLDDYERESSVIHHDMSKQNIDDDDASHYSTEEQGQSNSTTEDEGPPTPKPGNFALPTAEEKSLEEVRNKHNTLPALSSLNDDDFHLELRSYMSSLTDAANVSNIDDSIPKLDTVREFLDRARTPEPFDAPKLSPHSDGEDEPGTPDSVIRHPVAIEPPQKEPAAIPEQQATVKSSGSKLTIRPSITPADARAMAAMRRQVSGEKPPPIPERSPKRMSISVEPEEPGSSSGSEAAPETGEEKRPRSEGDAAPKRRESFRMKLDLPPSNVEDSLDFSLNKEFDRVIEAQKKGYLMRQNTKVVVASSRQFSDEKPPPTPTMADAPTFDARGTRSAGNSPRKASHERSKTWTTEPWNGKVRRRSIRQSAGGSRPQPPPTVAPPMPGMESNVTTGLGTLVEDSFIGDDFEDGAERGRLFAKVVGVKDLDLPLPKSGSTYFQLTLDNGLHCVTTAWLELGRSAPIGQEFELVVLNDLEFQLTLQTKLEPPQEEPVPPPSPTRVVKQKSALSRFLSPRKRKDEERQVKEEADAREAAIRNREAAARKRKEMNPSAWDLMHDLVGADGSFARAYVCLKNHERQAFGRPLTVDVPCFNEWAVEDSAVNSSVKSKRGGVVSRPPYRIGKLTLQLLYVPKPKDAKDDDMPKSMNACIRELQEAEEVRAKAFEGHLSQQGGDCPFWRRRFFRLNGTKLTAYHETTHQPRATINLAKASKLIDDRSQLTKSEATTKNGGRRKSAFAEEDGGYMFVEEGFRIRFANGETIDFYADDAPSKEGWMSALATVVGKDVGNGDGKGKKGWADMVLARERADRAAATAQPPQKENNQHAQTGRRSNAPTFSTATAKQAAGTKSAPVSPMKSAASNARAAAAPASPTKQPSPKKRPAPAINKPLPRTRDAKEMSGARRGQVRSMLF